MAAVVRVKCRLPLQLLHLLHLLKTIVQTRLCKLRSRRRELHVTRTELKW
jgi:hypothetical protein